MQHQKRCLSVVVQCAWHRPATHEFPLQYLAHGCADAAGFAVDDCLAVDFVEKGHAGFARESGRQHHDCVSQSAEGEESHDHAEVGEG